MHEDQESSSWGMPVLQPWTMLADQESGSWGEERGGGGGLPRKSDFQSLASPAARTQPGLRRPLGPVVQPLQCVLSSRRDKTRVVIGTGRGGGGCVLFR